MCKLTQSSWELGLDMEPSLVAFIPSQGSVGTKLTSLILFPGDFNLAQQLSMGEAWRTVGMFRKERQLAIPRAELRRGGVVLGLTVVAVFP